MVKNVNIAHLEHGNASPEELALATEESQIKLSGYVIFLSSVAALAGLLFGYDTGIISVALPTFHDDLGHYLTSVETEWITASLSVGALIGALAGGIQADRWGRKMVLLIGDAWFVVGAVVVSSSYSIPQILVGRIFLGFGVGIASAVAPVYIAELAPTRFRGALITIQSIAITGGQLLAYILGIAFNFRSGWRGLFALAVAPAIIQGVAMHFLPESPRFQLVQGKDEQARKTIANIYKRDVDDRFIELKMNSLKEVVELSQNFKREHSLFQQLVLVLTRGNLRRPAITAVGLCLFQQLSGFNTLMYYSATIFSYVGFDNPAATGLIVAGTNAFFTIAAMFILDRVGKRRILWLSYPGMIVGLALAALAFAKMTESTNGRLVTGADYPAQWINLMLGMMVVFIASYAIGLGNIPWQGNELFPLQLRGLGAALLSSGVWAGNIIISATFLSIMNGIGAAGAFGLYAGICALGLVFVLLCYPEVSGLSLEEIEEIYLHGFGIRASQRIRRHHKKMKANDLDPEVEHQKTSKEKEDTTAVTAAAP